VVQDVVHASSLAVKAITALLVQTLYLPVPGHTNVSKLIHVSRYPPIKNCTLRYVRKSTLGVRESSVGCSIEKLRKIQKTLETKHTESSYLPRVINIFKHPNFEKRFQHYSYGQMSVKYLMLATKTVEVEDNCQTSRIWEHKTTLLDNSGLDINSCLQFLLDYYTQLLKNQVNCLL
jgi:hypothetical protein